MSGKRDLYSKRFGQVLLIDRDVAESEISALELSEGDHVLEIGPGTGVLTDIILGNSVNLTCVESDHRFVEALMGRYQEEVKAGKLRVVKGDFLDFQELNWDKIVGNVPYHISSQIIFRLPDFKFDKAVLMVQKDFADRMIATPGSSNYSRLSVNCAYWFEVHAILGVGRESFSPVPEVDSTVITIRKKSGVNPSEAKELDDTLKELFSKRRKKIGTVYRNCPDELRDKRPDQLTLEDFILLTKSRNLRT